MIQHVPFYLDWTFWTVVVSFLAILLSQLPPIHILLRPPKLDVEAYSRMHITHKVGNPNTQLHLIVTNAGGREVKIKSIILSFTRGDEDRFTLPAQTYVQSPGDKDAVLLTSFKLKPKEEWAHLVNFLNFFSRNEEKEYRQFESNLKNDILQKRDMLENKDILVEAENNNVQPIIDFYKRKFRWLPGEYEVFLEIRAVPEKASIYRKYRITLFESDSIELQDYIKDFKYGGGVYYDTPKHTGLILPLTEA